MLDQFWGDVVDGEPTLIQHWFNVSCLLGSNTIHVPSDQTNWAHAHTCYPAVASCSGVSTCGRARWAIVNNQTQWIIQSVGCKVLHLYTRVFLLSIHAPIWKGLAVHWIVLWLSFKGFVKVSWNFNINVYHMFTVKIVLFFTVIVLSSHLPLLFYLFFLHEIEKMICIMIWDQYYNESENIQHNSWLSIYNTK